MSRARMLLAGIAATALAAPALAQDTYEALAARANELAHRAQVLEDERAIENLTRAFGFYIDRGEWGEAAALFAEDGAFELNQHGVYVGPARIRAFLERALGPEGLVQGRMTDALVLQPVIHVAADETNAHARARGIFLLGEHEEQAVWADGVYENAYVKEDGVWKFQSLQFFATFVTDFNEGWAESALPLSPPLEDLPPDHPPTVEFEAYPTYFAAPFHYPNPVSGEPVQYRADSTVEIEIIDPSAGEPPARTFADFDELEAAVATAEHQAARANDHDAIDRLVRAYGYYLDKSQWDDLADLFARDGSMELAQRGVFVSQDRVREFLHTQFGPARPAEGRLGDHLQMQPVITVSEAGQSAQARSRMISIMAFAGRGGGLNGAIYENEFVKEDGVWKYATLHAFNTYNARYDGAWATGANPGMPGENPDLPPDMPPTVVFEGFPNVYEIPFHYPNPVTGE
jgi:hypothetical protein